MRTLIARESAPCQPLCSLTFEMGGKKAGKTKTLAWSGPRAPSPRRQDPTPPLGKMLR